MSDASFATRHKTKIAYGALVAAALILGARCYTLSRVPGVEVATIGLPGSVELDLGPGDALAFTVDADVRFVDQDSQGKSARPQGCELRVALEPSGQQTENATCDAFRTTTSGSAADSESRTREAGTNRVSYEVRGQRVGCRLTAKAKARTVVRAEADLTKCVEAASKVTVHVFRDGAD